MKLYANVGLEWQKDGNCVFCRKNTFKSDIYLKRKMDNKYLQTMKQQHNTSKMYFSRPLL